MNKPVKILSIGQCNADAGAIARTLADRFDATVDTAHSATEALRKVKVGSFDLVLINRILDADGTSGLDLLELLIENGVPVMLVSDRADAQDAAVALGGVRGFGKSALSRPDTATVIQRALGLSHKKQ